MSDEFSPTIKEILDRLPASFKQPHTNADQERLMGAVRTLLEYARTRGKEMCSHLKGENPENEAQCSMGTLAGVLIQCGMLANECGWLAEVLQMMLGSEDDQ